MLTIPNEFELLGGPLEERGNLLLRSEVRVLKVYRQRRALARELMARFSHWAVEGKRSPSPAARRETERLALELWGAHGFEVPKVLEGAAPPWIGDAPYLWLSYEPGLRLYDVLWDPAVSNERKGRLVDAMAQEDLRRHHLALELGEPLLLHEHPTTKHKLVVGEVGEDRLVTFDLEGGYMPGYSVPVAVGYEIAGIMRSMWHRPDQPCFDEPWPQRYLETYDDRDLLREVCEANLHSFRGRSKAWNDRRNRKPRSKSAVLEQLRELLAG